MATHQKSTGERLNDARVKALWQGSRVDATDPSSPGLIVRATSPTGRKFYFRYQRNGRRRYLPLGKYGDLTLKRARELAAEFRLQVERGDDPALARDHRRKSEALTFEQLARVYFEKQTSAAAKSLKGYRRQLELHVFPLWGQLPAESITPDDVVELHEHLVDTKGLKGGAKNAHQAASRVFSWAIERRKVKTRLNPFTAIKVPVRTQHKKRPLQPAEIATVWRALDHAPMAKALRGILRLQLLTGVRVNEAAGAAWAEIDLRERLWRIPPERMKGRRSHTVPLAAKAIATLETAKLAGRGSEWVFPNRIGDGPMPRTSVAHALHRIRKKTGMTLGVKTHWTSHNLRDTLATELQRAGVPFEVVAAILAHKLEGVTAAHYAAFDYLPQRRDALERWEARLDEILAAHADDEAAA